MEKKEKLYYESPLLQVNEVVPEGIVCMTGDDNEDIGGDGPVYGDDDFN